MSWTRCIDEMPQINVRVLVYDERKDDCCNSIHIDYLQYSGIWSSQEMFLKISHWMHLPKNPDVFVDD